MDAIRSLLDLFDIANYLPNLTLFAGTAKLILWILMLVGPALMTLLGLTYYLKPPAEANFSWGFRTYFGMGSVEAWRFTQKLAGIVWTALGLILSVIMFLISGSFRDMDGMVMLDKAVACILWEIGIMAAACVIINIFLIVRYDRKGNVRWKKKK